MYHIKVVQTVHKKRFFNNRMLVQALCMTGSDLCSASKDWHAQEQTAIVIYDEFYDQVQCI